MSTYAEDYAAMRAGAVEVSKDSPLFKAFVAACQTNPWLKIGGCEFEDGGGLCCEHDYPFYLQEYESPELLQKFFEHGNWAIRAAVLYRDLLFVNQVNGGDEWWTVKIVGRDTDSPKLWPFESITWERIIQRGEFASLLERMTSATVEQCRKLDY